MQKSGIGNVVTIEDSIFAFGASQLLACSSRRASSSKVSTNIFCCRTSASSRLVSTSSGCDFGVS
jgi:hypothetical protein